MNEKPEISWDHDEQQFYQDGQPITHPQALERWNAIDSDWTAGAFRIMQEITVGGDEPRTVDGEDAEEWQHRADQENTYEENR